MTHVFIDSSVFFSASYSATGASREIFRLAIQESITLVTSELVIEETEKNLTSKAPEVLSAFQRFLDVIPLEFVRPTKKEIQQAATYTAIKDAAIVAAAKKAQVDYLVSLDRRHLVDAPEVARKSGLKIVLPKDFLNELRSHN